MGAYQKNKVSSGTGFSSKNPCRQPTRCRARAYARGFICLWSTGAHKAPDKEPYPRSGVYRFIASVCRFMAGCHEPCNIQPPSSLTSYPSTASSTLKGQAQSLTEPSPSLTGQVHRSTLSSALKRYAHSGGARLCSLFNGRTRARRPEAMWCGT